MPYKSKLFRYIIKFLAIPILVMPSSVILASMDEQSIAKPSELAKKHYLKQSSLESKKNQNKNRFHKKQKKNNFTLEQRRCLSIKQQISDKHFYGQSNNLSRDVDRTNTSQMLYENHNCDAVLSRQADSNSSETKLTPDAGLLGE